MCAWTQSDLAQYKKANEEITYISWSYNTFDLFHRIEVRTQSSMNSEYPFIEDRRNWHAIEAINENFPQTDVISLLDGVPHYLVDWYPTLLPEHLLEHAKEMVDKFEAQLRAQREAKNGRGAQGLKRGERAVVKLFA